MSQSRCSGCPAKPEQEGQSGAAAAPVVLLPPIPSALWCLRVLSGTVHFFLLFILISLCEVKTPLMATKPLWIMICISTLPFIWGLGQNHLIKSPASLQLQLVLTVLTWQAAEAAGRSQGLHGKPMQGPDTLSTAPKAAPEPQAAHALLSFLLFPL